MKVRWARVATLWNDDCEATDLRAWTMPRDSGTLLELIGDVHGVLNLTEFRRGLLHALARAIPSDWVSLNDIGPDPDSTVVIIEPEFPGEDHTLFARLAHQNPLITRFAATGDGRAYRFSDVVTPGELHSLDLYREFYERIGLEYQVAFTLPHPPTRLLGVALSRRDSDFSPQERELLNDARPFLITAYRNAIEHAALQLELRRRPPPLDPPSNVGMLAGRGLTPRECEVLGWVATGRSNAEIALQLSLSERTVHKHLQTVTASSVCAGVATRPCSCGRSPLSSQRMRTRMARVLVTEPTADVVVRTTFARIGCLRAAFFNAARIVRGKYSFSAARLPGRTKVKPAAITSGAERLNLAVMATREV